MTAILPQYWENSCNLFLNLSNAASPKRCILLQTSHTPTQHMQILIPDTWLLLMQLHIALSSKGAMARVSSILQEVSSILHRKCQICYTGSVQYATQEVSSMLHRKCPVCYTGSVQYATQEVSSMLHRKCPVCYTGSVQYATQEVSSILHRKCPVYYRKCCNEVHKVKPQC